MHGPEPVREIQEATPEEMSRLEFISTLWGLRRAFARADPRILWHYTTGESLIGIIEKGELWATQVSCLNDQTELIHAASLLTEAFQRMRDEHRGNDDQVFLTRALETLSHNVALQSDIFVASFSEIEDDLGQWRAYGGGEAGYAIGLNREGIDFGLLSGNFAIPVEYDIEKQVEITTGLADAVLAFYRRGIRSSSGNSHTFIVETAIPLMLEGLAFIGPFLKNDAFRSEKEWRVMWRLLDGQENRLRIRQKRTLLSRHFPLDFQREGAIISGKLPIVSIGVGPCRHPGVSVNSVQALLRSKGYPTEHGSLALHKVDGFPLDRVTVWASDIPYQTV
jgi:hypothetical protein